MLWSSLCQISLLLLIKKINLNLLGQMPNELILLFWKFVYYTPYFFLGKYIGNFKLYIMQSSII